MRNLKKFLALVLAMMMALSMVVTANAASWNSAGGPFDDNKDVTPVFDEGVSVVTGMKIFEGDNNGDFRPAANITRAEAAAVVYRLATGDVKDKDGKDDSALWTNVAPFYDVTPDKWYAGYVGYLWNAEIIKGANAERTAFNPSDEVTGYEVLAMVLRAMGYDQNDEFTGAGWQIRVGQTANDRGLLTNVNTTNYGSGHLNAPARRDTIAEIVFQAATRSTVVYTPAYGYQTTNMQNANGSVDNTSLGYANFGLVNDRGIVVGNQSTGESVTKMTFEGSSAGYRLNTPNALINSFSYIYGGVYNDADASNSVNTGDTVHSVTLNFDHVTPLNQFGHANKVWYDANSGSTKHTYAWIDQATKTEIVSTAAVVDDGDLTNSGSALAEAAKTAGFTISTDAATGNVLAFGSNKYDRMGPLAADADYKFGTTTNYKLTSYPSVAFADDKVDEVESPAIHMYSLISNSGTNLDVIISLDAEVAEIFDTNTTHTSERIVLDEATLGGPNVRNTSGKGEILTSHLTPNSVKALGAIVEAWVVDGTTKVDNTTDDPDRDINSYYQTIEVKNGPTGTVSTLSPDGTVTLTTGETLKKSYLYDVVMDNTADPDDRCIDQSTLTAGVSYTFVLDQWGRYLGTTTDPGVTFIYGTFADHSYGAVGSGDLNYLVYGVDANGGKTVDHALTQMQQGNETVLTPMNGSRFNDIEIARRDYGNTADGNQVANGVYRAGWITADGKWYVNDEADLQYGLTVPRSTVNNWADAADWTITSTDAARGFKDVSTGGGVGERLITNNTEFYVVSGTGTSTLNVKKYVGMTQFLDGATEAIIESSYQDMAADGVTPLTGTNTYDVAYMTNIDTYHSTDDRYEQNAMVTKVFMYEKAVKRNSTTTMYYVHDDSATGLKIYDANGIALYDQYELWQGGTKTNLFLTSKPDFDTFYTLQKNTTVNGVDVYDLVAVPAILKGSYALDDSRAICWENQDIDYFATNDTSTGRIGDAGKETVYGVKDATVIDLTKKSTMHSDTGCLSDGPHDAHNEITNVAELFYAISVGYDVKVSIVNTSSNVSLIYVVEVDDTPLYG